MLKHTRPLITREESRLDEHARHRLKRALEQSQALQVVYRFKQDFALSLRGYVL